MKEQKKKDKIFFVLHELKGFLKGPLHPKELYLIDKHFCIYDV